MNTSATDLDASIAAEVTRVVELYDFTDDVRVTPLSRSENIVFLVDDPARETKYVARVNSGRLAYHTGELINCELDWLTAIREDTDVIVPEVIADRDGQRVHTLNVPGSPTPRFVSLYSFISGAEPSEENLPAEFRRLGSITARLHNHAKSWTPPVGFKRLTWTEDMILDDKLGWGHWQNGVGIEGETAVILERAASVLRRQCEQLPKDRESFGMIHADLRLANILVDGDQIAIIDFDDCGFGWYLSELPAALSFIEDHPDRDTLIHEWIAGYRAVSNLDQAMIDQLPTLFMLRRFALLAWLGYQVDHLEFAREIGPRFTMEARKEAEAYLARFG